MSLHRPTLVFLLLLNLRLVESFTVQVPFTATAGIRNEFKSFSSSSSSGLVLFMSDYKNDGIVELVDDDEVKAKSSSENTKTNSAAPFLSQGDIQQEALELSNDPKQARVIIYIIISLLPVLFLVPLMLGSRDLIPLDALPPVELN